MRKVLSMAYQHYKDKKIGIWGFGKTGQSVLHFFAPHTPHLSVIEKGTFSEEQQTLLQKYQVQIAPYEYIEQFLEYNDLIIPSPGVDVSAYYEKYADKIVSELELFARHNTTKTIAITGSVGKTTTVTLLTELLNACGIPARSGGNIGTPLLSLLADQASYEFFVIELSSFQLELPHTYAPTYAAITNLFANHLDRHHNLATYAKAKGNLLINQTDEQWAVIPMQFLEAFIPYTAQQKVVWLADDAFQEYFTPTLSDITFTQNWQIIFALLELLGKEPQEILPLCTNLHAPEHRFEFLGTYNGITFYNDSKATIAESTLESVNRCKKRPTILFLGGLSKGVDRSPLIKQLPASIKSVLCFGKEADTLHDLCSKQGIISSSHATLEDAWTTCTTLMQPGDIVLFSPAGASFDLFKNYEERGKAFKKLVTTLGH